jgi:hypothetical protein
MKRNVYYGEYTLKYWIELMMKGNIKLPQYQRFFVWDKGRVQKLINSIKGDFFVPPVTIGLFKEGDKSVNYILDGQQRLTSILLAYLELFPKKEKDIKADIDLFADENDDNNDDDILENIQEWTFMKLTELGKSKAEILDNCDERLYESVKYGNSNSFFYKKYLGFTYIVPNENDESAQQKFYSSVFRNINQQGEKLLPIESRKSLYYLRTDLNGFFEPSFANIRVNNTRMDFVRYLALLFQYHKCKNTNKVSKGYPYKKSEDYYENFIYSIVGERPLDTFEDFRNVFPEGYDDDFKKLERTITAVFPQKFTSVIDLDMYMFGMAYQILFMKNQIDLSRKDELVQHINDCIEEMKNVDGHKKNPSFLRFMRSRIQRSIEIYETYAVAP